MKVKTRDETGKESRKKEEVERDTREREEEI